MTAFRKMDNFLMWKLIKIACLGNACCVHQQSKKICEIFLVNFYWKRCINNNIIASHYLNLRKIKKQDTL